MSAPRTSRTGVDAASRRSDGESCGCPKTSRTGADAAHSPGGVGMGASGPAELLAGVGVSLSSRVPVDVSLPGDVEDVGAAVEAALTRDDALGRLMDRAFSLPPPALPKFEE